jgi:hypothetical protein
MPFSVSIVFVSARFGLTPARATAVAEMIKGRYDDCAWLGEWYTLTARLGTLGPGSDLGRTPRKDRNLDITRIDWLEVVRLIEGGDRHELINPLYLLDDCTLPLRSSALSFVLKRTVDHSLTSVCSCPIIHPEHRTGNRRGWGVGWRERSREKRRLSTFSAACCFS